MVHSLKRHFQSAFFGLASVVAGVSAAPAAQEQPLPWQMTLQPAATEVAHTLHGFESFTFWVATLITLFVLGLLLYVMVKFNAKANPVPSRVTHHSMLEVAWTVVPILILVGIAVPSFKLLYKQVEIPATVDMTVKATGKQWFWEYSYPDLKDAKSEPLAFESRVLCREAKDCPAGQPRLLAATTSLVVPVGKTVRVQVTAQDVIHAFAMPSFGLKIDAMPGRLNETWFKAERTGTFYGQCSELCGTDHAYMPIQVKVVTEEQYAAWSKAALTNVEEANKTLAAMIDADAAKPQVASR